MATHAPVSNQRPTTAAGPTTFHALILSDPALQALLGAIEHPNDYATAVNGIARRHGMRLAANAAIPTGKPAPLLLDRWPGAGWLPARSVSTDDGLAIDWSWFGTPAPTDPFYEDWVRRHALRPFNRMFRLRTTLNTLVAGAPAEHAMPDGLIFHLSRCGSTLVAQMLAAPRHRVVSEAEPIDAVVQWCALSNAPLARQIAAVRAIVAAVAPRSGGERLFVKLDAWHTRALPLFRAAFPEVPWIFLYRDPLEVLVSHRGRPGLLAVAGGLPPSALDIAGAHAMALEDQCACALAQIGDAVFDHWQLGGGMLVDYVELPEAMVDRIPAHFGFVPDATESAAMLARARHDAKAPGTTFMPDATRKQAMASPRIRRAAETHLRANHTRLDALRRQQLSPK